MLSIVTDEISFDPVTAICIAREWGVRGCELRRVFLKRVPYIEEEGHQALRQARERWSDLRIVALSPGLYKCSPDHWAFSWESGDKLDESFRLCHMLACPVLIVFGVARSEKASLARIVDHFGMVARRAESGGVDVAIEIEPGTWADSARAAAEVCLAVGSPRLGINWDVSNAAASGEKPLPDGYLAAKSYLKHLHVKGSRPGLSGNREGCVLGEDDIGWPEIFKRLAADGYRGALSVETHLQPKYEKSKACVACAQRMLAETDLKD